MTQPSPSMTRAWLCVALLWVVAFLNYLDRVMLTTIRPSLVQAIPMTDAQFALLTSAFLWVYAVASPFAGFLADRFSRRCVIVGSLFAWSAITWLTGHAKTFDQLLFARSVMGISEAFYIPAGMALIMDYHRGPTRSLANGIHVSGVMIGSGLGGLGGWFADHHAWNYAFNLFGLVGVIYSVFLFFVLRDAPREENHLTPAAESETKANFLPALKSLFSRGSFFLALLFWGLLGLVGWGVLGWMPTYFKEQFGLTQGTAGFSATGYLQVAAMIGVIVAGFLTDFWSRTGERRRITVTAIGLCIAAPGILLTANTTALPVAICGLMLYGLMRSFADVNMMPILCLIAEPRYRATGYGILNFFACVVGGLTIYVGGALRDANVNINTVFECAAFSMIICAVLLFLIKPSKTLKPAAAPAGS